MDERQTTIAERWQKRYRIPVPMWSILARSAPERGLVAMNPAGVFQLHAWQVATGELRPLTRVPHGVLLGEIAPDGRYVYYHSDEGGNELGHWVRIPFEGGPPESLTPALPPFPSFSFGISGSSGRVGFNMATQDGFAIVLVDEADGQMGPPREIFRCADLAFGPILSQDGGLAAVMSNERISRGMEFNLAVLDAASGERLSELWDGAGTSIEYRMFSPVLGDDRILGKSNKSGTNRPFVWNPRTGQRTDLAVDSLEGDISPLDWSADARYVLLGQVLQARQHLHLYDLHSGTLHSLNTRPGTWGWAFDMVAYFGPTGEIFAHWQDATHPEALVALDTSGNVLRTVLPARGETPPSRPWRSISFTSDGQEIQGWLCMPEGEGPFPTILDTHGGPFAATTETFSPDCQAFVDYGFAYCTINYRGSTTFGREFQEVIIGDPGHREVADMVAARNWLVEHNVAKPHQILLTGYSYGGYLTLLGLGLRPDLWAGGMAGVPVTDWAMLYEDSPSLHVFAANLLDGAPEDRPEQYAASSPLTYVGRVDAPVLIVFGRNDTRCPARPVEEYVRRLVEAGKHVEVYEFEGGHLGSFVDAEEGIREQEMMLDFASKLVRPEVAGSSSTI